MASLRSKFCGRWFDLKLGVLIVLALVTANPSFAEVSSTEMSNGATTAYVESCSQLRTYVFPLTQGDQHLQVALIGSDRSDVSKTSLSDYFFRSKSSDFGIRDVNFEDFDPMFLVFLSERGIHDVYTFNMGLFNPVRAVIAPKLVGTPIAAAILHPESVPSLPYLMMDAQHVIRSKVANQLSKYFWELATIAPFVGVAVAPLRLSRIEKENMLSMNLKELGAFLSKDLESADSVLKPYLSREKLFEFLVAVDARSGRQNTLKDLFFGSTEKRISNYRKAEKTQALSTVSKLKKISIEAEKEGLKIIPFGPNAGIIAIDLSREKIPSAAYQLVSKAQVDQAAENYRNGKGGALLGVSAFLASQQTWVGEKVDETNSESALIYKELLNFQHSQAQVAEQVSFNTFKLVRQIGYTIWPAFVSFAFIYGESALGAAASWTDSSIGWVAGKFHSETARFLRRLFSFNYLNLSDVLIASELGVLTPAPGDEGKFFGGILNYIKGDLSKDEFARLKADFASNDLKVVANASRALMLRYLGTVENSQYIFHRADRSAQLRSKKIYLQRLANWLEDRPWRSYCGSSASCREDKAERMNRQIQRDRKREERAAGK